MELVKIIGYLFLLACGYVGIHLGAKIAIDYEEDRILGIAVILLGVLTVVTATGIYFS